ncbi:asparagine synthase-related protein, partial [Kitasatospora sp. NPDC093558]|uniref:asparagine synthase-related protein n=1 Tax=Kitasatospora sp. NPDC093558 TaxID=3155201 RepID=UPI00343EB4EB
MLAWRGGAPWIIGRVAGARLTAVRVGYAHVAVIGDHRVEEDALAEAVRALRPTGRWQGLASFPGSYHLVVADRRETWMAGDIAGLRQVFTAQLGGRVLLGSHARPLAGRFGGRVDSGHVAHHLLGPVAPVALAENGTSPYLGISAVPPGVAARVDAEGSVRQDRWWSVPDDAHDKAHGADALLRALQDAVAVRAAGSGNVAVELSGGLDSSAISALAFQQIGARTLNLTRASSDPANDDLRWARTVAAAQPGARHHVLEAAEMPRQFDGFEHALPLDAPGPTAASPYRGAHLWHRVVSGGARTLLSGKGGDELLVPPTTYLHHAPWRTIR